jgi:hypothetical protein
MEDKNENIKNNFYEYLEAVDNILPLNCVMLRKFKKRYNVQT